MFRSYIHGTGYLGTSTSNPQPPLLRGKLVLVPCFVLTYTARAIEHGMLWIPNSENGILLLRKFTLTVVVMMVMLIMVMLLLCWVAPVMFLLLVEVLSMLEMLLVLLVVWLVVLCVQCVVCVCCKACSGSSPFSYALVMAPWVIALGCSPFSQAPIQTL